MPVSEKVAKLWGKLTTELVWEAADPLSPKGSGVKRWYRGPWRAVLVPDPAAQPWAWVKAIVISGTDIRLDPCHDGHIHVYLEGREVVEYNGDLESALAAAVEKLANDAPA